MDTDSDLALLLPNMTRKAASTLNLSRLPLREVSRQFARCTRLNMPAKRKRAHEASKGVRGSEPVSLARGAARSDGESVSSKRSVGPMCPDDKTLEAHDTGRTKRHKVEVLPICMQNVNKSQNRNRCGASTCIHHRQKSRCKDCGGSSFCIHGRRKSRCKDCVGRAQT